MPTRNQHPAMMPANPSPGACWLVVAHCFNMDGRAASQTITDRLDHLIRRGVRPVVISAPTGDRHRRVAHYRIFSPAPSGLLFEGRQIIDRLPGRPWRRAVLKAVLTLALLPAYLVEKLVLDLDSQWSWFLGAVVLGLIVQRRHRPDLVYSSAGPPSSHLAGWLISRLGRLPWLAEVHDPLVYGDGCARRVRDRFLLLIETVIFRDAAAIVYFTEAALEDARRRHRPVGRTAVLRPGADPPDVGAVAYRRRERIHFGHFGSLGPDRHLGPVVQALHAVLAARPQWRDRIRLDVYGTRLDPETRRALQRWPLGDVVVEHGRLEFDPVSGKSGRRRVLEAMRRSDVLVLVHGGGPQARFYVPSKLYEYLLMHRPILCCAAPDSELARLLGPLGQTVVDGRRPERFAAALAELVVEWAAGGLADRPATVAFKIDATVSRLLDLAGRIGGGPRCGDTRSRP